MKTMISAPIIAVMIVAQVHAEPYTVVQPLDTAFPEYDPANCKQEQLCSPGNEKFSHDALAANWEDSCDAAIIDAKRIMNERHIALTYGNLQSALLTSVIKVCPQPKMIEEKEP